MAKVEMNLNEYDALKGELDFLRRVVKEITTPVVDTWNLEYYRRSYGSHTVSATVSDEVKKYLESQVANHIPAEYATPEFNLEICFSNPTLLTANFVEPTPEDTDSVEE